MMSDTGSSIRYHAHKNIAREELDAAGILVFQQFNQVDWEIVHSPLTTVSRMFQVWVCRDVREKAVQCHGRAVNHDIL